jgi:predicted permease
MDVPKALLHSVLPLYGFIVLGFLLVRRWQLGSKWISKIMLYVLIPFLIIENLLKASLADTAIAGSMIFVLAVAMNLPATLSKKVFANDIDENLLRGAFSYYNIGWFGIPVVMALFGQEQMPLIISAYVGNVLYGDTIGYYLMSRSKGIPVKTATAKVFKIPAIYACLLAVLLNVFEVKAPEELEVAGKVISWIVSALGMLIIGITLSKIDFKQVAYLTFTKILGLRYIAGAGVLIILTLIEKVFVGVLDKDQSSLMLLISSFPIAANLVVFAAFLDTQKENSALLVGMSSVVSLILVPLLCLFLF